MSGQWLVHSPSWALWINPEAVLINYNLKTGLFIGVSPQHRHWNPRGNVLERFRWARLRTGS